MHIKLRPIDEELRDSDFRQDGVAKGHLKAWLNGIWEEKERLMVDTLDSHQEAKSEQNLQDQGKTRIQGSHNHE